MTTQIISASPWRPTYRGLCGRRDFLRGYAAVATLAFGSWLVFFCAMTFHGAFDLIGVDTSVVFGPIALLAMMAWLPMILLAGFVYLPGLIIRRMRSIGAVSALCGLAAIVIVAWLRLPAPEILEGKNPVIVSLRMMFDPAVIASTLLLALLPTKRVSTAREFSTELG